MKNSKAPGLAWQTSTASSPATAVIFGPMLSRAKVPPSISPLAAKMIRASLPEFDFYQHGKINSPGYSQRQCFLHGPCSRRPLCLFGTGNNNKFHSHDN
jgi:hypothetical protein